MENQHEDIARLKQAFQTLELDSHSSEEMVRQAYRELVKVWHPDRFENDEKLKARAQEKLKKINLSYELLLEHFASAKPFRTEPYSNNASATESTNEETKNRFLNAVTLGAISLAGVIFLSVLVFASSSSDRVHPPSITATAKTSAPQPAIVVNQGSHDYPGLNTTNTARHLSQQEKNDLLLRNGYDPAKYELDDNGTTVYLREESPEVTSKPVEIPKDVKFVIFVDRSTGERDFYFSKKKPEPFGAGYKIYDYFTKSELVVTGQLTITPVND